MLLTGTIMAWILHRAETKGPCVRTVGKNVGLCWGGGCGIISGDGGQCGRTAEGSWVDWMDTGETWETVEKVGDGASEGYGGRTVRVGNMGTD